MRFGAIFSALLWAIFSFPAFALTITFDPGGRIDAYEARWQQLARSGETVRIDGLCGSACTLLTGLVPRNRVCVTSRATLLFHAAHDGTGVMSQNGTAELMRVYPAGIRSWIGANGGLTSPQRHIRLAGAELRSFYRACP